MVNPPPLFLRSFNFFGRPYKNRIESFFSICQQIIIYSDELCSSLHKQHSLYKEFMEEHKKSNRDKAQGILERLLDELNDSVNFFAMIIINVDSLYGRTSRATRRLLNKIEKETIIHTEHLVKKDAKNIELSRKQLKKLIKEKKEEVQAQIDQALKHIDNVMKHVFSHDFIMAKSAERDVLNGQYILEHADWRADDLMKRRIQKEAIEIEQLEEKLLVLKDISQLKEIKKTFDKAISEDEDTVKRDMVFHARLEALLKECINCVSKFPEVDALRLKMGRTEKHYNEINDFVVKVERRQALDGGKK